MVCVAVTRIGRGDLWLFPSRDEADQHPLVQYGDAILSSPETVLDQYNRLEFAEFMKLCGMGPLADQVHQSLRSADRRDADSIMTHYAQRVWEAAQAAATQAPEDPHQICDLVRRDRVATRGVKQMARTTDNATAEAGTEGAPAEKAKRVPPKREPKHADNCTIKLLADKEGKTYGPDHNPKKAGSKSAPRFALYTDGMTVGAYVAAATPLGGGRGDLDYDAAHGFISIEPASEA